MVFKEENNYGLTQLFGNKIKDDDEILDKLTEAFKIQYKNNLLTFIKWQTRLKCKNLSLCLQKNIKKE